MFFEKIFENVIEDFGVFYYWSMIIFVDKVQGGVFDEFIEFFFNEGWCNNILFVLDEECWCFDLVEFVVEVMLNSRFCGSDNLDSLVVIIDCIVYFVDEFFGSYFGVEKGSFCFFVDKFIIVLMGE